MRGQHQFRALDALRARIIPARAGPTATSPQTPTGSPDHPRSCGANKFEPLATDRLYGSSPLVRGQLRLRRPARIAPRIIPARAGPTFRVARASRTVSDHPRSCGANPSTSHLKHHTHGSSPLVRGQLHSLLGCTCFRRIIPARAGPTYAPSNKGHTVSDHPRSCGANQG